jgi:hypothetical protein
LEIDPKNDVPSAFTRHYFNGFEPVNTFGFAQGLKPEALIGSSFAAFQVRCGARVFACSLPFPC